MAIPYKRTREVYWAAGIFEGEGSISATKRGRIGVEMTDLDIVKRFAEVVGVGTVTGPRGGAQPHYKPRYLWSVHGRRNVEAVLRLLYPLLGERRRAQADQLLALEHLKRPVHRLVLGGTCRNGHLLTDDTLYVNPKRGYKHCKPCRKAERPPGPGQVRGARVGSSKLTEKEVLAIRRAAVRGASRKDLAAQYGVTVQCIAHVVTGKTWWHVSRVSSLRAA